MDQFFSAARMSQSKTLSTLPTRRQTRQPRKCWTKNPEQQSRLPRCKAAEKLQVYRYLGDEADELCNSLWKEVKSD